MYYSDVDEADQLMRQITSAATKSSSAKMCGLKGFVPHTTKLLTALLAVAALVYADPKRVAIWNYVTARPGCWRNQICTSLLKFTLLNMLTSRG